MARKLGFACILGVFLATCADSQFNPQPPPYKDAAKPADAAQQPPDETEPPEEDETVKPKVYHYDPLEAQRNIRVGNFYLHQGSKGYHAAAGRFEDATKYDPKNAQAFYKLGEVEEKLKHKDKADSAFRHVIELSPDSKLAKEAQKKLGQKG